MATDKVEAAVLEHVHKQECGCWTWTGPKDCNVIRLLAELVGNPLPAGRKMYRMPECTMAGADCVNPDHVGTSEDYMARIRGDKPLPGKFDEKDIKLLKRMGISMGQE